MNDQVQKSPTNSLVDAVGAKSTLDEVQIRISKEIKAIEGEDSAQQEALDKANWWMRFNAVLLGLINGALFAVASYAMMDTVAPAASSATTMGLDIGGALAVGAGAGGLTIATALKGAKGGNSLSAEQEVKDSKKSKLKQYGRWVLCGSAASLPLAVSIFGFAANPLSLLSNLSEGASLGITAAVGALVSLGAVVCQFFVEKKIEESHKIIKGHKQRVKAKVQLQLLQDMIAEEKKSDEQQRIVREAAQGIDKEQAAKSAEQTAAQRIERYNKYITLAQEGKLYKEVILQGYYSEVSTEGKKKFKFNYEQMLNELATASDLKAQREEMISSGRRYLQFTGFALSMLPAVSVLLGCIAVGAAFGPIGIAVGAVVGITAMMVVGAISYHNFENTTLKNYDKLCRKGGQEPGDAEQKETTAQVAGKTTWFKRNKGALVTGVALTVVTIAAAIALMANPIMPPIIIAIGIGIGIAMFVSKMCVQYRTKRANELNQQMRTMKHGIIIRESQKIQPGIELTAMAATPAQAPAQAQAAEQAVARLPSPGPSVEPPVAVVPVPQPLVLAPANVSQEIAVLKQVLEGKARQSDVKPSDLQPEIDKLCELVNSVGKKLLNKNLSTQEKQVWTSVAQEMCSSLTKLLDDLSDKKAFNPQQVEALCKSDPAAIFWRTKPISRWIEQQRAHHPPIAPPAPSITPTTPPLVPAPA